MSDEKLPKLPALQFYVGDWIKDPGIRALTLEQRGAWFEILLLMHESEQRGMLTLNGKPMPLEALAQSLGTTPEKAQKIVKKLLEYGVATKDKRSGALVNRRMLKDEDLRRVKSRAGRKGGQANRKQTPKQSGKQTRSRNQAKRPSSSSSSSSSSTSPSGVKNAPRPTKLISEMNRKKIIASRLTLERYAAGWAERFGDDKAAEMLHKAGPQAKGQDVVWLTKNVFNGRASPGKTRADRLAELKGGPQ